MRSNGICRLISLRMICFTLLNFYFSKAGMLLFPIRPMSDPPRPPRLFYTSLNGLCLPRKRIHCSIIEACAIMRNGVSHLRGRYSSSLANFLQKKRNTYLRVLPGINAPFDRIYKENCACFVPKKPDYPPDFLVSEKPRFFNSLTTALRTSPCRRTSRPSRVPPTPHFFFKSFIRFSTSSSGSSHPSMSVTVLPARPFFSIPTRMR